MSIEIETGKLILLKEKEEALKRELKALEQLENKLQQSNDKNDSIELGKVKLDIQQVQSKLTEIKNEILKEDDKCKSIEAQKDGLEGFADHFGKTNGKEIITQTYTYTEKPSQTQTCTEKTVQTQTYTEIRMPEPPSVDVKNVADPIIAATIGTVVVSSLAKEALKQDAAKDWEKDIDKREKTINEKCEKEIKYTENELKKTIEHIEKKYDNKDEKETKTKELKDTIEKVKVDIEKERSNEIQKLDAERARLEEVKEATRGMEERERQKEIERQRQLELERQRLLDAFNKNR